MSNNDTFYTVDFGVNFANKSRYPDVELEKLMEESYNSGVDKVVCISNNITESKINLELEKKFPNLHYTLGIHPHNSKQFKKSDVSFLEANISNPKCFGIGECGLDYNRMFSPKEKQLEVFGIQIDLASKYNLPLYLHCRDAWDDFIGLLREKKYFNGLVHCFTGNLNQALELVGLGFKLGITGWIFDSRRNNDLVNVVKNKKIPLNMLVVETDAPFMPIRPAKISIPSDTGYIVEEIARLRQIDIIDCGKQIYSNSIQMLNKIV